MDRETAVARKWVEDSEIAIRHEQEDKRQAENAELTIRKPKNPFQKILNTLGDSVSNYEGSDNEQDGENKEEPKVDTQLGKMSKDDESGFVKNKLC